MKFFIEIEGMKCEGCVSRIHNMLGMIKEIKAFEVRLEERRLYIELKNEKILNLVEDKIVGLGFEVINIKKL